MAESDHRIMRVPFGTPDASREDLNHARASFVDFAGPGGIATRHDDLRARVIVGRKGAGKTLYLRRARAHAVADDGLYADDIQQNLPSTSEVVAFANCYPLGVLTEKWMGIWRCAILRSLATHVLHNRRLGAKLEPEDRELLATGFVDVMGDAARSRTPLSVYSQVRSLITAGSRSAATFDKKLARPEWDELEYLLGEFLSERPPVCFYIDAIDEEFRHAPAYWLMCQKGLFYQVMRLLRDTRLGGRLHVFISIRDHVYTSVFGSEHATRYFDPVHIRLLEWDSENIEYFLAEKVRRLSSEWLRGEDPSVNGWLGVDEIRNEKRRMVESPTSYLLRHTRLLPRDIVVLGNALSKRMRQRDGSVRGLTDSEIRQVVHDCARVFGREQLEISANQIAADLMHEGAALQEISEIYTHADKTFTGSDVYQDSVRSLLSEFIRSIGQDRFSREQFARAREQSTEKFGAETDVLAVLWQNGLLGQIPAGRSDGRAIFYSASSHYELRIDDAAGNYALHPCLIDALGIASDGPGSPPIVPVAYDEV